jgi:pimeloyl-ACP methyl ester carboxylesterase
VFIQVMPRDQSTKSTQGDQNNAKSQSVYAYTGGKIFDQAKPCIVFLHGAQNDHSVWILQSRYLANHGYAVLALDLPGHGRSSGPLLDCVEDMASWVLDVLASLEVKQATLVGHSMGSLIALEAAAKAPKAVNALALLGTANPMKVSDALLKACVESEPQAFDLINRFSHSSLSHLPGSPGPGFSVYWQGRRLMERQAPKVLVNDFSACNAYLGGEAAAAQVTCPTLILSGEKDAMTPPRAAQGLRDILAKNLGAGLRHQLIKDCGHALMAEQPDVTLLALRSFLAALPLTALP